MADSPIILKRNPLHGNSLLPIREWLLTVMHTGAATFVVYPMGLRADLLLVVEKGTNDDCKNG
jgi:hypothetical protein